MNQVDKLTRDAKIFADSVKDTMTSNLMTAIKNNVLVFEETQLAKVLSLLEISASEGYQKAIRTFQKSAKSTLTESDR